MGRIFLDNPSAPIPCIAWDISIGGAKLSAPHPHALPERFSLVFGSTFRFRCRVCWRGRRFVGVEFVDDETHFPKDRRVKDRRANPSPHGAPA
jgi:hypothetical protein